MNQTTLMGRATVRAVGLAMAVLLAPSVGPVGPTLQQTGAAWAAPRSAAPLGAASAASAAMKITAVAGGLYHGLALGASGTVFAWGWNIVGQLCNGNTNGSAVPVKVKLPGGTKVIGIAAGFAHSLMVTASGAVLACGKNYDGELGDGTTTDSVVPVPVKLPVGTRVSAVAASAGHNLALTTTGAVLAWGLNNEGQLGDGGTGSSAVPVNVSLPAGTKVTAIATGALHSLALTASGALFAWGYNADGELGNGGTVNSAVPVEVKLPAGTRVSAIAAGGSLTGVGMNAAGPGHSLALTASGAVLAWGYNADGELGNGGTVNSAVPVEVKLPAGTRVSAIAAGEVHSLAVTLTGAVLAWGGNNFGQLGEGSYAWSAVPLTVKLRGFAVRLTATPGLVQPALTATALATTTRSTTMAGYNFANYIAVPGAVSAIIVVPRLTCSATPAAGSALYAGVGIQSVNSYARLYLACTPQGVARVYPSLVVNGTTKNIAGDVARAGDTIEFAVSQSASQVTDAVIDLTHPFIASSNGAGSGTGEGITVGDYAVVSGGTTSGVPNFGTLTFFSALINGYPFGSASPSLQTDDLGASSTGPLEIKTTYSAGTKEAFATVFRHS